VAEEILAWRKSSRCETGACLEVASAGDQVAVRDSKTPDSPFLWFSLPEWRAFVVAVRAGDFEA